MSNPTFPRRPIPCAVTPLETLEGRRLLAVVNGLTGAYFHRADLTDPAMQRVDATVNFDWGSSSPASNIQPDTFSVRWTGQVQAKSTGLYTFYTTTDDGVRLWVNNQLLIDRWRNQAATEYRESISLVSGQKYDVKLEYYENTGNANAKLRWSGPGVAKQIIPTSQLFTTTTDPVVVKPVAPTGLMATATSSTSIALKWNDVANETGYRIERRRDGTTEPWTQVGTTGANVTQFQNTGLLPSTTYLYRVLAFNSAGSSPYSAVAWTTTPATTPPPPPPPAGQYDLTFSTFLGGSQQEQARDITTDAQGNIYVTGGGQSPNFPTTAGAFDTTPNGSFDVFVTKYSPTGQLIWSTVLGGSQYDRAYALEVDAAGYVYVAGRAGPGLPTTAGAFQPAYNGFYTGAAYGNQNAFIAKLKPDGSGLVFATYFGSYELIRDLAIDADGDIYVAGSHKPIETGTAPPATWFAGRYQPSANTGWDNVIAKVKSDGSQVLWATYLGGSANDGGAPSIRVDAQERPVVVSTTSSADFPTTTGAYDRTYNGGVDMMVAKFSADGSQLLYSSYLGGSGNEGTETHNLALDSAGNAYITGYTQSSNLPTTTGAFQRIYGGGANDAFIMKVSADGTTLLASTYYGGSGGEGSEGVNLDAAGNVYISGPTNSANLPMAAGAFRATNAGLGDMFVAKFTSSLTTLSYSTYLGGTGNDSARTSYVNAAGDIFLAGHVEAGFFTKNAAQPLYGGSTDSALAKFRIL
jgi:hypothetical protein